MAFPSHMSLMRLSILFVLGWSILILMMWHHHHVHSPRLHLKHDIKKHVGKNGYTVFEIQGLLTPQECNELIATASTQGLVESQVWSYDRHQGNTYDTKHRKSKQTWLHPSVCAAAQKASDISVGLTGIPATNQELVQIAMYEEGGMFNAHFDACQDDDKEYCDKMNHNAGQRKSTLLIYLNDDFKGGETEFVDIGVQITPKRGNAILFFDTHPDESVILESKHRAHPVYNGKKWICTVWSHSKEYKDK